MDRRTGYRIGRHTLLILAVMAVAFNQIYMGFLEYHELFGNSIYLFSLFILVTYLLLGYFNIYILVPRLLLKERYPAYFTLFFFLIMLFLLVHYGFEYAILKYYRLDPGQYSYFNNTGNPLWLELLSSFLIDSMAILGVSFMIIFKHWLINDMQVHELETLHMQSEVEKLKEQINPVFLLSILHNVGDIVDENQEKASDMLMDLSEILRYQLYDCNRQEVLLHAEISFIRNYLQLERCHSGMLSFEVATEGDVHSVFIPPLLFLPIVQYAVKKQEKRGCAYRIDLCFRVDNDSFSLFCSCAEADLYDEGLKNIWLRLNRLYPERYELQIREEDSRFLHLKINF